MFKKKRIHKHKSIRKNIFGTENRPRLSVFKSSQHIYVQVIDDSKGKTLVSDSDVKLKSGTKREKAAAVGEEIAKKLLQLKIKKVVFDRGGYKYQGRVTALADAARKGGLQF